MFKQFVFNATSRTPTERELKEFSLFAASINWERLGRERREEEEGRRGRVVVRGERRGMMAVRGEGSGREWRRGSGQCGSREGFLQRGL